MTKLTMTISALALAFGCQRKVNEVTGSPKPVESTATPSAQPAPAPPVAGSSAVIEENTGIAACDHYVHVYNQFRACEGLSTSARDSAKTDVDRLQETWSQVSPTAAAADKAAASDACTTATETLEQAAKAVNCNL